MLHGASTAATVVQDETSLESTHAVSSFIDLVAEILATWRALVVDIKRIAWWTHAVAESVDDVTLVHGTDGHLVALHGGVALISWQTLADHRSHWDCIEDTTNRIDSTWLGGIAWIDALAADTSSLRRAFSVRYASVVQLDTATNGIVDIARWTCALRLVLVHATDLFTATDNGLFARILALVVDARFVKRTIIILLTLESHAGDSWISCCTWSTFADWFVGDSVALGIEAAGGAIWTAGGYALTVNAAVRW